MTLTPIRQTLITLLSDGQFHSGEQLGEQLGISRAAVSKHMAALKELGLDLFSLTGKGYRLAVPTWPTGNPPDLKVWRQTYIHDFLRYVRDHGHLFACHEYYRGDLRWNLGRFITYAYPQLPDDLRIAMPKVVFTEFGEQGGRDWSVADTLTRFREWQKLLEPYGWIIGGSVWAVGDTGAGAAEDWTGDNLAKNLAVWAQI